MKEKRERTDERRTSLRNAIAAKARGDRRRQDGDGEVKIWTAPARITLPVLSFLQTPVEGEDKPQGAAPLRLTMYRDISESDDRAESGEQPGGVDA